MFFLLDMMRSCILILYITGLKFCLSQRRIINGRVSTDGKKFMVYLLNAPYSNVQPDAWLCGGALISESRILTSAACLIEVEYMYAIAGYKKYVSGKDIDKDECTRTRKQKVVEIIVPKAIKDIGVVEPNLWMKVDVGIAVVEKPYNFSDLSYRIYCSYEPASILINYDIKLEQPNTVGVVYGWGGTKARKPGENGDINSKYLREARTVITNNTFCANYVNEELKSVVNDSLICAFGTVYSHSDEGVGNECNWRRFNLNETDFDCNEDEAFLFRNRHPKFKFPHEINSGARRDNFEKNDGGGICENDHGGPLISWIGSTEVIIGVALTSIYNIKYECQGPFLYLGTARSGSLIQCLLTVTNKTQNLCQNFHSNVHSTKIYWPEESDNSADPQTHPTEPITGITSENYDQLSPIQFSLQKFAKVTVEELTTQFEPVTTSEKYFKLSPIETLLQNKAQDPATMFSIDKIQRKAPIKTMFEELQQSILKVSSEQEVESFEPLKEIFEQYEESPFKVDSIKYQKLPYGVIEKTQSGPKSDFRIISDQYQHNSPFKVMTEQFQQESPVSIISEQFQKELPYKLPPEQEEVESPVKVVEVKVLSHTWQQRRDQMHDAFTMEPKGHQDDMEPRVEIRPQINIRKFV